MKKGILYLFLFTYSTVMFKPIMPYITDFMAHLLFYKEHMLTVHAHHGKFHVHTAVTEGAKNDQSEKSTNNLKKDNQVNEHIFFGTVSKSPVQQTHLNYFSLLSIAAVSIFLKHDFPPPRI